jgi:cell division protein FtsQ
MAAGLTALRQRVRARTGRRLLLGLFGCAVILVAVWMWVRTSPLVAIERVRITGVSGPEAAQIRGSLRLAARNMTTMDVNMGELQTTALAYPQVARIAVSTQFPHGIWIRVSERTAVAEILIAGTAVAVSGDGTLLGDAVAGYGPLPLIPLAVAPGGNRLTEPGALAATKILVAAPQQLRAEIEQVTRTSAHGVVAQLRGGPSIYFGSSDQAAAKWRAVIAVLADPSSAGAVYLDVTDPVRPAAGGLSDSASTPAAAAGPSAAAADPQAQP